MKKMAKIWAVVMVVAIALLMTGCGVNITQIGLPVEMTIEKGDAVQLDVVYGAEKETTEEKLAEAAAKLTLNWSTSDETVVAVDETGMITAVAAGEADITVAVKDSEIQAVCHVTVVAPATGVSAPGSLELKMGQEEQIKAAIEPLDATDVKLVYESSDETVATVDEDGKITAISEGSCTITTSVYGVDVELGEDAIDPEMTVVPENLMSKTEVNVIYVTKSIELSATTLKPTAGKGTQLVATNDRGEQMDETEISWTSSDTSIAVVAENGWVDTIKAGNVTFTATTEDGLSNEITITVQPKPVVRPTTPSSVTTTPTAPADSGTAVQDTPAPAAPVESSSGDGGGGQTENSGGSSGGDSGGGQSNNSGGSLGVGEDGQPIGDSPGVYFEAADNANGEDQGEL